MRFSVGSGISFITKSSVISRNDKFCVVYSYFDKDGKRRQKWETFKTFGEANTRKIEIEYSQQVGNFVIPNCTTVSELMKEYVSLYGKTKWSPSVYSSNTGLINHYIEPYLGKLKLAEVTSHTLERYYQKLLTTPAVPMICVKKYSNETRTVTTATVRKIHNVLRSAFTQAMKWDLIEKNPAAYATVPKHEAKEREIWDAQTIFKAIELCKDPRLKLCLNLAFSCTLRIGELLALTWDCVDFEKHTLRVYRQFVRIASGPDKGKMMYTPLKNGKERTITLTTTAMAVLQEAKRKQSEQRLRAGSSWHNEYNMIFTRNGMFVRFKTLYVHFKAIVKRMGRPGVRFHDVRHTYATLSLQSHVDPKTLSEALGHATVAFTLDVYGHSNADMRQQAAEQLEQLICQY